MGKTVEVTMTERSGGFSDSDVESDEIDDGHGAIGIQETLLINDTEREASVNLRHLLFLTSGVGG